MQTIIDLQKKYFGKIDQLDLDLIVAHILKKSREFVLTHPEHRLSTNQKLQTTNYIARRIKNEPLAYILGHKEFYGLNFRVTPATLIPRPETELLVEEVLKILQTTRLDSRNRPLDDARRENQKPKTILDIGTGSGNIIISIATHVSQKVQFYATDISSEALAVAKSNAKLNKVNKKIKFLHGSLLEPIAQNTKYRIQNTIIIANLPYLSHKIYTSTLPNVKKYEPKSALFSRKKGLDHYKKLLKEITILVTKYQIQSTILLEISPEQKTKITKIIKKNLPHSKIKFYKDLAGKSRICKIEI